MGRILVSNHPGMEAAQIGSLFSRARLVLAVNVINAIIIAFFLWHAVPTDAITGWVFATIAICAARFGFLLDYEQKAGKPLEYWKRVSVWGSAISGIGWGMATIILFPSASPLLQIFLPVVMMGMMAGSAVSWYAYFPAFKAYFFPVALLTLARFAEEIVNGMDRAFFGTLGAMFVIFSAGLYQLARQSNRDLSQLLLLKSEKEEIDARYLELSQGVTLKEQSLGLLELVFRSSREGILVTDAKRRIVEVNPAFTRITGYAPDEVVGKQFPLRQSMTQGGEFFSKVWQSVQDEGSWNGEIWDSRKDGEIFVQRASIGLVRHPGGDRYVLQFSDVTEGKKKDELIWLQANFDALTNLPNRRLLRERLDEAIEGVDGFALLLIDLDRFKEINETLGHDMGDLLILEAALRIGRCMEGGTLARVGGDAFMLILQRDAEKVAERILDEFSSPFMIGDEPVQVSASLGMTYYPADAVHVEGLLKNAEQAMYRAKEKGGNSCEYFTEAMQQQVVERIMLGRDLRQAMKKGELDIHYQPIVDLKSGKIVKAEALLRWRHSLRGMLLPDLFIPIAEESGMIVEIGEWLFNEAASRVREWQGKFGDIALSINESALQFSEFSTEKHWLERLEEFGLPRNSIAIEITESVLLKESGRSSERLRSFHEGGIEISIDDFGTGFSSFSYLKQFDVDYLKIDRSFISGLTVNRQDMAITEAVISMAHKLGIRIIAEGVETADQRDMLVSFGCDYAQGFLYSPPLPAEEFEKLLENAPLVHQAHFHTGLILES